MNDELVEKAAEALRAWNWSLLRKSTGHIGFLSLEQYRMTAKVCLEAVLPDLAPAHLCDTCPGGLKCERKDDIEYACADGPFPARAVIVECGLREKWVEYVKLLQKEDAAHAREAAASEGR